MKRVIKPVVIAILLGLGAAAPAGARVLRVGTYHGHKGQYKTIQAAVNAAKPGDWILIAPGDYKTTSSSTVTGADGPVPAGVLIAKKNLTLRGMNRNMVIVDGTKSGPACSANTADQNLGPSTSQGPGGLNGIMVWKADNVSVENLTACNFLAGADSGTGNEIWWNGGADSAQVGGWGFYGAYLNATSTFYNGESSAAQYGIFSSDWSGGTWDDTYASNFNDSGYYIGACQRVCDQTVDHAWAEFNALGYSGSNSGGRLLVENSQFDNNEDGFDTNSQNGDNPPPQNGACPPGAKPPVAGVHTCWVFTHNYVHDNNNPNIPSAGLAAAGPVGTGLSLSGARNDTVIHNTFANNKAWGTIVVPFPDSGPPCTGGTSGPGGQPACLYDPWGDAILENTYSNNGGYHNPTNGDIALSNAEPGPTDCFAGNVDKAGLKTTPSTAEQTYPVCNGQTVLPSAVTSPESALFTEEVACDSTLYLPLVGKAPCAPTDSYPRRSSVVMHPLPTSRLQSMPNPCKGVPANPWCPTKRRRKPARKHPTKPATHRPPAVAEPQY